MKTITTFQELCDVMVSRVRKKKIRRVWISTFGLFLGTYEGGRTYGSTLVWETMKELSKMCTVSIRLCIPDTIPCNHGCAHCAAKKNRRFESVKKWIKDLEAIGVEVIVVNNLHAKGVYFSDGASIVGGFNMTASSYEDFAVLVRSKSVADRIIGKK